MEFGQNSQVYLMGSRKAAATIKGQQGVELAQVFEPYRV